MKTIDFYNHAVAYLAGGAEMLWVQLGGSSMNANDGDVVSRLPKPETKSLGDGDQSSDEVALSEVGFSRSTSAWPMH